MPIEVGVLISVVLGASCFQVPSYAFASALTYLAVKFAFVVGGVIPEMAGGYTFSSGWFAGPFGQLIPVVALGAVMHRFTRPPPGRATSNP